MKSTKQEETSTMQQATIKKHQAQQQNVPKATKHPTMQQATIKKHQAQQQNEQQNTTEATKHSTMQQATIKKRQAQQQSTHTTSNIVNYNVSIQISRRNRCSQILTVRRRLAASQTCRINNNEDSPSLLFSSTTLALVSTKIEPSLQANIDIKPLIFIFKIFWSNM
jgi:hypothetical protein